MNEKGLNLKDISLSLSLSLSSRHTPPLLSLSLSLSFMQSHLTTTTFLLTIIITNTIFSTIHYIFLHTLFYFLASSYKASVSVWVCVCVSQRQWKKTITSVSFIYHHPLNIILFQQSYSSYQLFNHNVINTLLHWIVSIKSLLLYFNSWN